MKGRNRLSLNKATIIEALQEYLDKRISPCINVADFSSAASGDDYLVTVEVEEIQDDTEFNKEGKGQK